MKEADLILPSTRPPNNSQGLEEFVPVSPGNFLSLGYDLLPEMWQTLGTRLA